LSFYFNEPRMRMRWLHWDFGWNVETLDGRMLWLDPVSVSCILTCNLDEFDDFLFSRDI
jgi:hypothetical protein